MTNTLSSDDLRLREALAERGLSVFDFADGILYLRLDAEHSMLNESEIQAAVIGALSTVNIDSIYPDARSYSVMIDKS